MKNMKKAIAALAAGVMALTIAACGGGSGSNTASKIHNDKKANDSAQCQNKVKKPGVEKVTVWAWYPAIEKIVDQFNETHDDLQVCWTNAGQGSPEYTKFNNTIKAKTGRRMSFSLNTRRCPSSSLVRRSIWSILASSDSTSTSPITPMVPGRASAWAAENPCMAFLSIWVRS